MVGRGFGSHRDVPARWGSFPVAGQPRRMAASTNLQSGVRLMPAGNPGLVGSRRPAGSGWHRHICLDHIGHGQPLGAACLSGEPHGSGFSPGPDNAGSRGPRGRPVAGWGVVHRPALACGTARHLDPPLHVDTRVPAAGGKPCPSQAAGPHGVTAEGIPHPFCSRLNPPAGLDPPSDGF